ncbi:MAG TPA: hypothetical protein ENK10_06620 [Acidobacteria bacterium]|nr:hypothetical protein [Acidobacteriota bacterium]
MFIKKENHSPSTLCLLMLILALVALLPAWTHAADKAAEEDADQVVVGTQVTTVDAEGDRDAKFDKNSETPSGVVVDFFRWSYATDKSWIQVKGWDASQLDERFSLRAGCEKGTFVADYQSLPYRVGNGARSLLGVGAADVWGATFRIADWVQQSMQDPDGNGEPFYLDSAETAQDNALVQMMANDLYTGTTPFELRSRRRKGHVGFDYRPNDRWKIGLHVYQEQRRGTQALGSGTYQRITDVNGDGLTDSDYYFAVRGVELPAPIEYRTTRVVGSTGYTAEKYFFNVEAAFSQFDNDFLGVTYDNPFWFDGVAGTSGSRRGLWEQGRTSLEPSNEAYNLTFSGGYVFSPRTRLIASFSVGEQSQNDRLMPITTNGATIATADINRDGTVNALDDPTLTVAGISGMPSTLDGYRVVGNTLDASSDITAYSVTLTSRPTTKLSVKAQVSSYDYEGTEGIQVIPARTEYIESEVKLDWKGDLILHVPNNFKRQRIDLSGTYRISRGLKIKAFAARKSRDYILYQDPDDNHTRDSGTRAVSGTDDDILGVTAIFGSGRFSGRVTLESASRTFDGPYHTAGSGENPLLRQFDIANRDRTGVDIQLDFMPAEMTTIGVGYNSYRDDYDDSAYGLQKGDVDGWTLNINHSTDKGLNFYAYAGVSTWDADMHLRTKCKNCATPDGYSGTLPYYWAVPNFDWFSNYNDETTSLGAGLDWNNGGRSALEFNVNYVKGVIAQTTRNPGTPVELDPDNPLLGEVAGVALGHDFPDQTNRTLLVDLRWTRKITSKIAGGFFWRYEDFQLDDFQWDGLEPYGANFLEVDDATRFTFLDSRYRDFTAHILQIFVKVVF